MSSNIVPTTGVLYWQLWDPPLEGDGMVPYTRCCRESRLDLGSMSMPVEYIDPKDNMQFVDKIINSFASTIQIKETEPLPEEINCMFVIPTPKHNHRTDLALIVLLKAKAVNGKLCGRLFICVLNSGSTGCLFNKKSLLFGTQATTTPFNKVQTTTQGTHSSNEIDFVNDV